MRTVSRTWTGVLILVNVVVGGGDESQSCESWGLWLLESNSLNSSRLQIHMKKF